MERQFGKPNQVLAPVHLAITFRTEWNSLEEYPPALRNKPRITDFFKGTHEASHDDQYLWGYFGNYFHCKERACHTYFDPERKMDKKTWKGQYARLRYEEWYYNNYMEQDKYRP